jgi:hypothetical protein
LFNLACYDVTVCNITAYSIIRPVDRFCLIAWPSFVSTPATLRIDAVYTQASEAVQWHLSNTGQLGATVGNDVSAAGAWSQNAYGEGVVVQITVCIALVH